MSSDRVEGDAEPRVAAAKAVAVDIRQDHQLVVSLQAGERLGAVRERGPVGHGAAEGAVLLLGRGDVPHLREGPMDVREQIGVAHFRRVALMRRLVATEACERRVTV
jgi:hypothetical protein